MKHEMNMTKHCLIFARVTIKLCINQGLFKLRPRHVLRFYSYDIALSYLLKSAKLLKSVTSSILSNPCNAITMRIIYYQKNSKLK